MLKRLSLIALVAGGIGCGEASPREICEDTIESFCGQIFACFTDAERSAVGFSSEAACITRFVDESGCANLDVSNVCEGNESYDSDQAMACIDQIDAASCSQVREALGDDEGTESFPACDETCSVQ